MEPRTKSSLDVRRLQTGRYEVRLPRGTKHRGSGAVSVTLSYTELAALVMLGRLAALNQGDPARQLRQGV